LSQFPEHVEQMHKEREKKFEAEFKVRACHILPAMHTPTN